MRRATPNLRRRPLGQEATDLIRRLVLRGELAPGERLVEERLGELLGLSRTPVREALHRLEQEGILTKRPRGGYEVRPLTPEEVEEAMGVRGVLEAYAAELAARQAPAKLIRELEKSLEQFEEALARRDEERLLELNVRFHDLLYQAAGSKLLQRLLSELKDELERISRVMMSNMPAGHWSVGEHRGLVEAIKAHDPATAGRLAQEHVERGGQWLISHLREQNGQEPEA
ncbi:MAG: GntR family transcriptional regulator [Pseudomonadota bacterium]